MSPFKDLVGSFDHLLLNLRVEAAAKADFVAHGEKRETHLCEVILDKLHTGDGRARRLSLFGSLRDEVAEVAGGIDAVVLCFHYGEESRTGGRCRKDFFSEKSCGIRAGGKLQLSKKKPHRSGVFFS